MTDSFETHRPRLFGLAYRMLGSAAEAEDIVQEAYLRWHSASGSEIREEKAFFYTVVTRLCLDELKSARRKRETYPGPWLPEPIVTDPEIDDETLSLAFLVLLESLTPAERAAYLLFEVFDYSHAELARILGKSEASCRKLVQRAREQVRERRPRFAPSKEAHALMLSSFLEACTEGDLEGLRRLLAEEVVASTDSGGKVRGASQKPVQGRDAVARLFVGLARRLDPALVIEVAEANGWPTFVGRSQGDVQNLLAIETDGERIHAVRVIVNPEKLTRVRVDKERIRDAAERMAVDCGGALLNLTE